MFTYDQIFSTKKNILFVTAHPDDIVVFYGALIHKLAQDQKNIYVVTVTNGCRGSGDRDISEEDLGKERIAEEINALEFLGVPPANSHCLGYKDGEVESSYKLIGQISGFIRRFKADIVCTHESTGQYHSDYGNRGYFVQHRDHRKVGEAVIDAAYPFSRDKSFFPEQNLPSHTVMDILLTDEIKSNFELDYTSDVSIKTDALQLHKTQFGSPESAQEIVDAVKFDDQYLEKYFYIKLLW